MSATPPPSNPDHLTAAIKARTVELVAGLDLGDASRVLAFVEDLETPPDDNVSA